MNIIIKNIHQKELPNVENVEKILFKENDLIGYKIIGCLSLGHQCNDDDFYIDVAKSFKGQNQQDWSGTYINGSV